MKLVMTATPAGKRAYRQRRRGSLAQATEALRARYDHATAGRRRQFERTGLDPLFAATGDPLVLEDRARAMQVYGPLDAKRPSVVLRKVHAESWGDDLDSLVSMGSHYQARGRSALHAAGEAVALGAERGAWLGLHAAVSFDHAVERVRKALLRERHDRLAPPHPPGWTGAYMEVRPAPGILVHLLAAPPRTVMPEGGALVRDDSFWRRRLQDGDVIRIGDAEKITQR